MSRLLPFLRPGRSRRRPRPPELLLFAGRSNPDLARWIAAQLGTSLGAIDFETFSNGEMYCRFEQSVRGGDVFLLRSCSPPVNYHLVEFLP